MHVRPRRLRVLTAVLLVFGLMGAAPAEAQDLRIGAGGGWAIPTSEINLEITNLEGQPRVLPVDPSSGPNLYGSVGFVRPISSSLALGVRIRGQESRMRGIVESVRNEVPCVGECVISGGSEAQLRALTLEGRLILTTVGGIKPYFLLGVGVVHTSVDAITVDNAQPGGTELIFSAVGVTDAGGDVGIGASVPIVAGLHLDGEFRVTGSLPGGKENAVTMLPFSLGLAYQF